MNFATDGSNVDMALVPNDAGNVTTTLQFTAGGGIQLTRNSANEMTITNTAQALNFQGVVNVNDAATIPANA